jgi:DNA polymerase III epsilon subunit family exonuclease
MQQITFVALDCETTGLDYNKDHIIELGAVKFSLTDSLTNFDSLFWSPIKIPAIIERLTGITNAELQNAPKFAEKTAEIVEFCQGATLIGHNLQFDLNFLQNAGLDFFSQPSFDTFRLAQLLLPRDGRSLSLDHLSLQFGVKHREAHRALADAEATRDLFRQLIQLSTKFSSEKWQKIIDLKVAKKNWIQDFAQFILQIKNYKDICEISENTQKKAEYIFKKPTKKLPACNLLETSTAPAEFEAEIIFTTYTNTTPQIFAPKDYVCKAKLNQFLQNELSDLAVPLAAKLILQEIPAPKIFFEQAEQLLFDFVAADENCAQEHIDCPFALALKTSKSLPKNFSNHASYNALSKKFERKIVTDALNFAENLINAESIILHLPMLEILAPKVVDKLIIFWGTLGMLFREAAPQFGILPISEVAQTPNFAKSCQAAQIFLEADKTKLPPRIKTALERFLRNDPNFTIEIRSNAAEEIKLVVAPKKVEIQNNDKTVFLDTALATSNNDFTFIKKNLQLSNQAVGKSELSANCAARLYAVSGMPNPSTPQFFSAVSRFLLKYLPDLPGVTCVAFPNRRELGNFFDRACTRLSSPIFAKKIPAKMPKKAAFLNTGFSRLWPDNTQNFVLVKLPFLVKPDSDWEDDTLPAAVLRVKKFWQRFNTGKKFFILDPRLLEKNYGQDFSLALSADSMEILKFEDRNTEFLF